MHSAALATRERLRTVADEHLPGVFLEGEPLAFEELVRRHQSGLLSFVYRMIGDRERAEDLVQEAFIRVYRHIHRFDPSKKLSTWVYTIASNLAKNELRDRSKNPLVLFQILRGAAREDDHRALQLEDTMARPDELYDRRRLASIVDEAVRGLTPHHRQVFVLREIEGKSCSEIAEIAGCGVGTVKSRLNRARIAFAAHVEIRHGVSLSPRPRSSERARPRTAAPRTRA